MFPLSMTFHVFDLFYIDPAQVREFLIFMVKSGLVGGIYINKTNGKMYVTLPFFQVGNYVALEKTREVPRSTCTLVSEVSDR
jgi:hypothetical protein